MTDVQTGSIAAEVVVESISVRYTVDQVAALCTMFDRPNVLASLDDDGLQPGPTADAMIAAAARTLVSGWIVSLESGEAGDADLEAPGIEREDGRREDVSFDGEDQLRFLHPHGAMLRAIWSANALVHATFEDDTVEELVVLVSPDAVVERRPVVPGVHEFTLAPVAGAHARIIEFLDAGESGDGDRVEFQVRTDELERLERALRASDDLAAEALLPNEGTSFLAAVAGPIAHGRLTVLRREEEGFTGDSVTWLHGGDDGLWLVDGYIDAGAAADAAADPSRPVTVKRVTQDDLVALTGIAFG